MGNELLPERRADVLTVLRELSDHRCGSSPSDQGDDESERGHTSDGSSTIGIEVGINLIEEIEWSRITFLDRKDYDLSSVYLVREQGRKDVLIARATSAF
jgi:hypothetical protein